MLQWVWFAVLTIVGLILCVLSVARGRERSYDDSGSSEVILQLAAHGVLGFSLMVTSDVTVMPVYEWLSNALPQHGSRINQLTAFAITGLGCLAYVAGLPVVLMIADYSRRDAFTASLVATEVIQRARAPRK